MTDNRIRIDIGLQVNTSNETEQAVTVGNGQVQFHFLPEITAPTASTEQSIPATKAPILN